MADVIRAESIYKKYKDKYALEGADLCVHKGEIHGLLGPNGAGKTTLIKIITTLLQRDSGTVEVMGHDIDKDENSVRHLIGYVGQDTERSMYARLNPVENLRFFGALRGLRKDYIDERIAELSLAFNIEPEILDRQFMKLSGGQKQSMVIMRSLLHNPPIVILDEPTKGLDPIAAAGIRRYLGTIVKEGKSLLLTSHILSEVDELSDRCSLINHGKIHVTDTPQALKNSVGATEFIELERQYLTPQIVSRLSSVDSVVNTRLKETNKGDWYSFGVDNVFDGLEDILKVLRTEGLKVGIKQHSISLEDAFIHHIGAFKDEVKG